eukprot:TRINITY_DN44022_c0_g1_i2.p1 TRINITY_DN44022_c0_g1~~TRINITY_DN44022_c0_g1_i2.p1  ORF type:complete len:176 (-),score=33.72 TRINITY_DN44022_c0_g1_i2:166-693(-)
MKHGQVSKMSYPDVLRCAAATDDEDSSAAAWSAAGGFSAERGDAAKQTTPPCKMARQAPASCRATGDLPTYLAGDHLPSLDSQDDDEIIDLDFSPPEVAHRGYYKCMASLRERSTDHPPAAAENSELGNRDSASYTAPRPVKFCRLSRLEGKTRVKAAGRRLAASLEEEVAAFLA